MKDQWTDDIKDLLKDYQAKAPEGMLDQVKGEMARRGLHAGHARTVPLWPRRAVAAAAVLAIVGGTAVWLSLRGDGPAVDTAQVAQRVTAQASQGATTAGQETAETATWTESHVVRPIAAVADKVVRTLTSSAADEEPLLADAAVGPQPQTTGMAGASMPTQDVTPETSLRENIQAVTSQTTQDTPALGAKAVRKRGRLGFGTGMGAFAAGDGGQTTGYSLVQADGQPAELASQPHVTTHEDHKRPLKVGLAVSYRINDRLSVQTGVTYAYLRSTITTTDYDGTTTSKQRLHYVGVLVTVNYSLWRKKRLAVYVAGGGEVQQLVSGHAKETIEHYDGNPTHDEKHVSDHRPQFSVTAAAGAEYRLLPHVGAYVEPCASYHFDNGSDVRNYYKDKKLNFGVGVGLRFHISK